MTGIADRHSLPLVGLRDPNEGRPLHVRIRVDEPSASSIGGQLLLSCLVNLLCRLVESVGSIELVAPPSVVQIPLPIQATGEQIIEACIDLAKCAVGDLVRVFAGAGDGDADITIHLGQAVPDGAPDQLTGFGDGWRSWVGIPSLAASSTPLSSGVNPMGPFLAASLLAAEVFKRARGITKGRYISSFGYSLWTGQTNEAWEELADGPEISGLRLPPFYMIGAGAVGQGLAYLLGSASVCGDVVVIDDDKHDDTNLNRCFLAGTEDETHPKIKVVDAFLGPSGVSAYLFEESVNDFLARPVRRLPPELAQAQELLRFETVVSCVDKGVSRQSLQGMWPRRILGGSTHGLTAKANLYDLARGTACLGCHNPPEPEGERIRALERQLAPLSRSQRAAFLKGKVDNLEDVLDYLENPSCGKMGEAEFRAGAIKHGNEFSVSFVSMGAATLLFGLLIRVLAFRDAAPYRNTMSVLNFLNGAASDETLAVNSHCDRCEGGRRTRFIETWPAAAAG